MWNIINSFIYKLISRYAMWYVFYQSQNEAIRTLDRLGISHGNVRFYGRCNIRVADGGKMEIGDNFVCQAGPLASIDCQTESKLQVESGAKLKIGNSVGMSSVVIYCWERIIIEDNVKIGAGCLLMDTNFHNTDPEIRCTTDDRSTIATAPIVIKDHAFIGTRCIICKGVCIGRNSIVAAGSVVVKSIPDNEVWGGNPAQFIKKI